MIDNRKINIDDMIKCVEREIGMRQRVYPRWVEQHKMSQEKADLEIRTMTAVFGASFIRPFNASVVFPFERASNILPTVIRVRIIAADSK